MVVPDRLKPVHQYFVIDPTKIERFVPKEEFITPTLKEWKEDMTTRDDGPRMPAHVAKLVSFRRVLDRD